MAPQTYQKWPHNDGDYLPPHPWMHYIRSQGLPYVQFFKYLLTYCAMDRSSLFQTSPLLSEAWNSWRIILTSKDWSREGTEYLGLFHVHFQQFPCPVQQQAHVFSTLPFAADTETLLFYPWSSADPCNLSRCNCRCALAFFNPLSPSFTSCIAFNLVKRSMQAPATFAWLTSSAHQDLPFLSLEEEILRSQPALLDPSSFQECIPTQFFQADPWRGQSSLMILFFAFFVPPRSLHSTTSWLLLPKLPSAFTSVIPPCL